MHTFSNSVGKFTPHRDNTMTVGAARFSGVSDHEFLHIIQSNIPQDIKYELKQGLMSGGGTAYMGGWVVFAVKLTLTDAEDGRRLRKLFKRLSSQ